MLSFDSLPLTPGKVNLTVNALDELYLHHSHLGNLVQNTEIRSIHLRSVVMLGGLAADILLTNGETQEDTEQIGIELLQQIHFSRAARDGFERGFSRGMDAQNAGSTIHEYRSRQIPLS
ncbi:hypothetical protein H7Y63_02805 [Polaromonas sp.]|nr:hypothetical protein [Candidatus Saccharibacteria bacterium]